MATRRKQKIRRYADGSVDAEEFLEELTGGPLTFAEMLRAIRLGEDMSQTDFAGHLAISRQHLCDLEKARRSLSPARAAEFARLLGYGEAQFVRLALQAQLDAADLPYRVSVEAA
jgi:transcriptional regulator with XRE-family HTH domain